MLGFYCGLLGMRELRRIEFAAQRYTLIFIGFEASTEAAQTRALARLGPHRALPTWGALRPPRHRRAAVELRSATTCASAASTSLANPARRVPGGRSIALIEDPDGNEVELLAAD